MNKGKLYAVGIGPGDPELMTLKAIRIIESADVLCAPKGRKAGESMALGIVEQAVDLAGKKVMEVHFPMTKSSQREALKPAVEAVLRVLREGKDITFVTLGDPMLYSTFFHLYDALLELDGDVDIEIVPGVSSINASGARAKRSLALSGEKLAVLPAAYVDDLGDVLEEFDAVVLMKVHSVFDKVRGILADKGMLERAVYVSRAGMPDETVKLLGDVLPEDLNYFSTIIVRKKDG